MNKRELVRAIAARTGDKRAARAAVDAAVDTIKQAVAHGERVTISGFGVFERVERSGRYARNPSTGERVHVEGASVPRFRPGNDFRARVREARGG